MIALIFDSYNKWIVINLVINADKKSCKESLTFLTARTKDTTPRRKKATFQTSDEIYSFVHGKLFYQLFYNQATKIV